MRDRRLLLLGLLVGQGQQDVADLQLGAALGRGELSPDELREIAIFLTHYAGWPSGARLSMQIEKIIGKQSRNKE
jgi:4-carboxymuconolactone decarboxylase